MGSQEALWLCIINNLFKALKLFTECYLDKRRSGFQLSEYLSNTNPPFFPLLEMDARDFIPINGLTLCGGLAETSTGDQQSKSTEDGK